MKLSISLFLLLVNIAYADAYCTTRNQWKCALFKNYETFDSGIIAAQFFRRIYHDVFKERVEKVAEKNGMTLYTPRMAEILFRYQVINGTLPDFSSFSTRWDMYKHVIWNVRGRPEMDFSDLVLAIEAFDVKEP